MSADIWEILVGLGGIVFWSLMLLPIVLWVWGHVISRVVTARNIRTVRAIEEAGR